MNEAVENLKPSTHTHNNKAVLDTVTEQYMQDQAALAVKQVQKCVKST